ncbi:MAG: 4Fe-4S ferredoxin [Candidatus Lokiarchaeota archaeon]|nr:4Fe-4S ferredoxin [Candidatus Lokiarchaeota archaeon]MBD3339046.1 4Fe-4S ferredoxin [Candidatus Lokiarchaeota archaeon]
MTTTLYYFTGTGNSLKIAKDLRDELEDCELKSIIKVMENDKIIETSDKIGFVFPLHYYGLPKVVYDFAEEIILDESEYLFAVVTKAGEWKGVPLILLEKILRAKSKSLDAGFFVNMPNNYILDMDSHSEKEQKELFEKATRQVKDTAKAIKENMKNIDLDLTKKNRLEKVNLTFHKGVHDSDKSFYVEETCNSCDICKKVCPVDNIVIVDGKPQWQHKCLQCLACLNYCPENAIQFGNKTLGRARYHHPEITIKDLELQKQ